MLKLLSLIRWVWFKIFDVNKPGQSSSNKILIHCHCNFSAHLLCQFRKLLCFLVNSIPFSVKIAAMEKV